MKERLMWIAIIAACVGGLYVCDRNANRRYGQLDQRYQDLGASHRTLQATAGSLATRFRTETVAVTITRNRWRTLLDSFTRFDTVQLTRRETLIVERATAALGACQDALGTCMRLSSVRDSIARNRDSALRVVLAMRPSFWDKARTASVWTGVGLVIGAVLK